MYIYNVAIFFLLTFACLSCSLQLGFCLLDVRDETQILRIIFSFICVPCTITNISVLNKAIYFLALFNCFFSSQHLISFLV